MELQLTVMFLRDGVVSHSLGLRQDGPGTEQELEAGTGSRNRRNRFPGTERGTGTAETGFQGTETGTVPFC